MGGGVLIDREHVFVLFVAGVYDNFWTVFNDLISVIGFVLEANAFIKCQTAFERCDEL